MKIKKVISKRAYNRVKFMCASGLGLLAMAYVNDQYVTSPIDGFFLSAEDDMGGIFVNAAEEGEDEAPQVLLDYKDEQGKDKWAVGDVHVAAAAEGEDATKEEFQYKFGDKTYTDKVVQTRNLGYVVEFYNEQQCYSYIVVPGS